MDAEAYEGGGSDAASERPPRLEGDSAVTSLVGAGIIETACRVGESHGMGRNELLRVGGLISTDLDDPDARLPSYALWRIVQHVVDRTGDRGFGLRFAEAMDIRAQGFWGYTFISCLSLRHAFQLIVRFSSLRHSSALSFWEEGDWGVFQWTGDPSVPKGMECIAGDGFLSCFCYHRRRLLPGATAPLQATLTYDEEPHHQALRALVGGPITFNAAANQVRFPRHELDLAPRGRDQQLLRLCVTQLERQLENWRARHESQDLTARVRQLMRGQLRSGTSLELVASALRVSVRTLRRRLETAGVSFLDLLERVRHEAAVEYLSRGADDIAAIATRLGYGDPSNFRRAFRRWTGQSPTVFRANLLTSQHRRQELEKEI
jgi:AraC-like DNA-binding protein